MMERILTELDICEDHLDTDGSRREYDTANDAFIDGVTNTTGGHEDHAATDTDQAARDAHWVTVDLLNEAAQLCPGPKDNKCGLGDEERDQFLDLLAKKKFDQAAKIFGITVRWPSSQSRS